MSKYYQTYIFELKKFIVYIFIPHLNLATAIFLMLYFKIISHASIYFQI